MNDNIVHKAFQIAKANGFHDIEYSDKHFISLIVSELYEAVEADRKGKRADIRAFNTRQCVGRGSKDVTVSYEYNFGLCIKDTVEDELADACIRILDFAGLKKQELLIHDVKSWETQSFNEHIHDIAKDLLNTHNLNNALSSICRLSYEMGIDLDWYVTTKMEYNRTRGFKHGKKY